MNIYEFVNHYRPDNFNPILNDNKTENYNPNNCKVIGVTGTYGKSSTCYILAEYLTKIGYKVTINSAGVRRFPVCGEQRAIMNGVLWGKNNIATFLCQALEDESDYVIFECHEKGLAGDEFDDLDFDLVVLSQFSANGNPCTPVPLYLERKQKLFNTGIRHAALINLDSENANDFMAACKNIPTVKTFRTNVSKLTDADLIVTEHILGTEHSQFKYAINNGSEESCITTLSMRVGIKVSATLIACLVVLNLYDKDKIHNFLANDAKISGRCQDIQWNGRNIVIDSGNRSFLKKYFEELSGIKDLPYKKYRVLYGLPGSDDRQTWEREHKDPNRIDQETGHIGDQSELRRYYQLIFGANLISLIFGKENIQKYSVKEIYQNVFSCISLDNVSEFNDQTEFEKKELEYFYEDLINNAAEYLVKNFPAEEHYGRVWTSGTTLKSYFKTHYEFFIRLYNCFKTKTDNIELLTACDFIKNILDRSLIDSHKITDLLNELPIEKVYMTIADEQYNSSIERINRHASFINKECYKNHNRKETIKQMLIESEPGDLLFVLGRGDKQLYFNYYDDSIAWNQYWTDEEYIMEVIKELDSK